MSKDKQSGGVSIGNVSGGIHGSIIASGDVKDITISLGGQPVQADKEPSFDEFQQLLAEIQQGLAEITDQKEALKAVSTAAPYTAQGAEESVKNAAAKVQQDMDQEGAQSVQQSLTEATGLLSGILDGATTVAEKAGGVAEAVKPLAEKLEPLVTKVGVAALWAAKLYFAG